MEEQVFGGENQSGRPARPLWEAMKRGFLGRCPHCGEGKLFRAFVKTADHCSNCGEEFSHHRADDLPAYLDIRLRRDGADRLTGLIGGIRRSLRRVPADTTLDIRLIGRWRDPHFGTVIDIRPDGTALWPWPLDGRITRLTPLPNGRALADLMHGPWRARPCLWLDGEGRLRVAGHRARILQMDRVD